jgi:hypothetical protein
MIVPTMSEDYFPVGSSFQHGIQKRLDGFGGGE